MSDATTWTVLELLRWTTQHFEEKGIESPRLDAECLLAHALGCDRLRLYLDFEKPVEEAERAEFRALVLRRASERVPVSLLIGSKEFWSLSFKVTSSVLTPRPDTETLVTAALDFLKEPEREYRVLDLGTGSGAVALAIASERPKAKVTATDLSDAALGVAQENAQQLGLSAQLRFLQGDWFEPVQGEKFDLIVSNPPYLARTEAGQLPPELAHEPEAALFSGENGLEALEEIARGVSDHLYSEGMIAVELGPNQAERLRKLFLGAGLEGADIFKDLAGRSRVVAARSARSV